MTARTRGLLVDFDGTLVDSVPPLMRLFVNFLEEQGIEGGTDLFDRLNGMSLRDALSIVREEYQLAAGNEELIDFYMQQVRRVYVEEVEPFEGARDFLVKAAERGLRVAIVTSAPQVFVDAWLEQHGLRPLVEEVVTADDLLHSKPDPAIYHQAVASLGLLPTELLAIEDSVNGMKSSLAAGVPTIALMREGTRPDTPSGVLATVTSFPEVLQFALTH